MPVSAKTAAKKTRGKTAPSAKAAKAKSAKARSAKTSEARTKPVPGAVEGFIASLEPASRQAGARALAALFARATGEPAVMWGPSIVGFGRYSYTYESGRTGESCRVGFSPRKAALTLYVGDAERHARRLAELGPHTTGKGCVYIKSLDGIDMDALEALVKEAVAANRARWPG